MSCTSACHCNQKLIHGDDEDLPLIHVANNSYSSPTLYKLASSTWKQINIKQINDCYLYHQLLLNHIDRKSNSTTYVIMLCRLIKMSYRNNNFSDSIRYYKPLWKMMYSMRIVLDLCSLRTCCFLLFYSHVPPCMIVNLLQNQQNKESIDIRKNDHNEIRKLKATLFINSVYLYLNQKINLPQTAFSNYIKNAEMLLEWWEEKKNLSPSSFGQLYDIYGYIGYYYSMAKRNPLIGHKYFLDTMFEIISKRDFGCNCCSSPLCIDKNTLLTLFCMHLTFGLPNYKMAYYMYKISLKSNPLDCVLMKWYGIFLMHCGKYKKALKYLKKSKRINREIMFHIVITEKFPSSKSYIEHAIDKIKSVGKSIPVKKVKLWFDVCFKCGNPSKGMKKCGMCQVASYCNKKCQKLHWKKHRMHCKAKDMVTIYDRMHYYLLRDCEQKWIYC